MSPAFPILVPPRVVVLLALAAVLQACTRDAGPRITNLPDGTPAFSHVEITTDSLVGREILATSSIGEPRYMAVDGTRLWISDRSGDPYLWLVDLRTGHMMFSRGYHGEGPGDFAEVPQLSMRAGDPGAVWAYDANLRRLTRVEADSAAPYRVIKSLGNQVDLLWSFAWQGDDHLIGIGDMDTNRIVIADSTGALLRMVPNALMGPDSVSLEARRGISSGYFLCIQPRGGRIAVLYLAGGQVDLYDPNGTHIRMADVPFPSDGHWVLNRRGHVSFKPDWHYYTACAASERFLYGLFAGHSTEGPGGGGVRLGLHVHVFDWDGRLRAVWALDRAASTMTVSGDTLLLTMGAESDGLYAYRLPTIRRRTRDPD